MNSFFASVEQQEHPELRGRPVGVVPMMTDSTCCLAASYEAKAFGIKTGTNVGDARRMCPEIQFVEAKHGPYRDYHNRIVEVVGKCTPVDKILSVDEMICHLWSNEREVVDAVKLARHIKESIHREVGECLNCSVGLSLNPFLAKVAAELEKPNGLVIIDDADIPGKLFALDLLDFPGINKRMQARFHAAGVFTTEQMYDRSVDEMRDIWGGVVGERWWHMLRGDEVSLPENPRRSVSHSHVLPPEMRTPDGAWSIAARLLEKACERMRHLGFHARSLGVSVSSVDGGRWHDHALITPSADTWTFMEVLSGVWKPGFRTPIKVGVVLYDLIPSDNVTLPLFDDQARRDRVCAAIDKLNSRYGRTRVTLACALKATSAKEDKIAFGKVQELD